MRVRSIIIACTLILCAAAVHAQAGPLDRVQNLIAAGRLTEARNTLAQWDRDNADASSSALPDDRARALYLGGVLNTDAKAAEDAFIGVVLGYPSSPVAPQALLRLGQSFFAAGETARAIDYLERLRSDYPTAPERQTGILWLARAQLAQGQAARACGTARAGLFSTSDANVRTLIELERDRACTQSGGIADEPAAAVTPATARTTPAAASTTPAATSSPPVAATPPPAQTPARPALPDLGIAVDANVREAAQRNEPPDAQRNEPRAADVDARTVETRQPAPADPAMPTPLSGEFAVQTAAFSERKPAETIAAELRAKGFDARIVQVPGSPYFRVRHGVFATSRDAANAALHVRDAGFATLVVNDVRLERRQ
jgi:cell division protein FtsN